MTTIAIGSDHGALELKQAIAAHLEAHSAIKSVLDLGVFSTDSVDYPDIADDVCKAILNDQSQLGILCCGTGIGISMRANRHRGIRAALVTSDFTAEMTKAHNNANILCFGGRTSTADDVTRWIDIWLRTEFEGDRHLRRIHKLDI